MINYIAYEYGLVNALLMSRVPRDVIKHIKPEYFNNQECKKIIKSVHKIILSGGSPDIASILAHDTTLSIDTLSDIADYDTSEAGYNDCLKAIKERSDKEALSVRLKESILRLKNDEPIQDIINDISGFKTGVGRLEMAHVSDVCMSSMDEYERIINGEVVGYYSGIEGFDKHFCGIESGLCFIAARPHMGKTTFSLFLAYMFAKQGYRVWYHTLEDMKKSLTASLACMLLNRDYRDYKAGYIPVEDLSGAFAEIANSNLFINEKRFSISELSMECNSRRKDFDIMFVDQLSHIDGKGHTIREQFTANVRGLQRIQKQGCFPMFVCAQISRKTEDRENKKPMMSDLKETGAIEEDADLILFPFRPAVYNKDIDSRIMEVHIAKDKLTKETGKFSLIKGKGGFQSIISKQE
jgi:replicative DNA helicase